MSKRLLFAKFIFIMGVMSICIHGGETYGQEEESLSIHGTRQLHFGGLGEVARLFTEKTGIKVEAKAGGCGDALRGLESGEIDFGTMCCPLTAHKDLKKLDYNAVSIPVAMYAVTIVVNKENPIDGVTMEQLTDIYTGKIKNWKEIGGWDKPIVPVVR